MCYNYTTAASVRVLQVATLKLEAALKMAGEVRDASVAANRTKCEEFIAKAAAEKAEVLVEADRMEKETAAAADKSAVRAVAGRWQAYVTAGLVTGEASNGTAYSDIEQALALAAQAQTERQKSVFECKARTTQVGSMAAREVAAASAALSKAKQAAEAALEEAERVYELSQGMTAEMRARASAQEAAAKAEASSESFQAKHEPEQAAADAAAAKEAEARAKELLTQAEADHSLAEAEAAATLERQRQSAATALALTQEQLSGAEVAERKMNAIKLAAAEADVLRKEAKVMRAKVEADRRQAEETFMRSQHDAIGRRPGGKKVLLAAQRELLSQHGRGTRRWSAESSPSMSPPTASALRWCATNAQSQASSPYL